jgi:hypothetical protein
MKTACSKVAQQSFRAAPGAYAVLCGPWLALALLWGYVSLKRGEIQLTAVLLCLLPALLFAFWLRGFALELHTDSFLYRSRFGRMRAGLYRDIASLRVSTTSPVTGNPLRGTLRLGSGATISINWRVFPREALNAFSQRVRDAV